MFSLKMYPARNGDAFLINAGGTHILVDAGYASTYHEFVSADLSQLAKRGDRLSLVVCTHIDADHIEGLLEFFALNGPPGQRGIEVDAVWHNSLRSLPALPPRPDGRDDHMVLEAIRRRGLQREAPFSSTPISARQGSSLAKLLRQGNYHWNAGDGTTCISDACGAVPLPRGVEVHVMGPPIGRLDELRELWLREVRRFGYKGSPQSSDLIDDAYEMWCAAAPPASAPTVNLISATKNQCLADVYMSDSSVSNGSSITFILQTGGRRVLFLGDAWAEDVVASLKPQAPPGGCAIFDAIKVSHHGSFRNTSPELLSITDSPCYLISSDGGRHGHPDFEVLAEIVDRPSTFRRQLFFNYQTDASRRLEAHASRSGAEFTVHIVNNDWIQVGEQDRD